jgi:hypothetical protein
VFETVDLYCERLGPGLWAEPLNALTNASFLVAAWFSWRLASSQATTTSGVRVLIALMTAIGIGSGLFHTFATNWARWLDVLPILIFQLVFVGIYCRRIAGMRNVYTIAVIFAYLSTALAGREFPQVLNGSLMYAPALVVLIGLGAYHAAAGLRERYVILGACGVFLLSVACRAIDQAVCPYLPIGTHFLWHLGNGLVLYLSMRGLLPNLQCGERMEVAAGG